MLPADEPFVVLPENRFAYTAVTSLSEAPSRGRPRAVFLYGPSGVGKSHLARHAVRLVTRAEQSVRCRIELASEFAAQLADAAANEAIPEFQRAARKLDLFVLEDLHALEGRKETQQQLLSVIDELVATGCRFVWTCRKPPGELVNFLPKLVNRFHAGVTSLVRLPGPESRLTLLSEFVSSRQIFIPKELVEKIAEQLPYSPRELLATVTRLAREAQSRKRPLDSDTLRKFLRHEVPPPTVSLADIARAVARQFGLSVSQLRARTRVQRLVLPRQCAMFLSRDITNKPLVEIGKFYGDRDHSTVVHACTRLRELVSDDPVTRSHLAQIRDALGTV